MSSNHKRFGDRPDGTKVRHLDIIHRLVTHIAPKRCGAEVYINEKLDITELLKYLEEKNKTREEKINFFHVFNYAIAKVIYHRPLLNRFVVNRKFYDRNKISLAFVAKMTKEDYAEELLVVVNVDETDKLEDISKKVLEQVNKARTTNDSSLDKLMSAVSKLPNFIIAFIVWFLNKLNHYGLMPKSIMEGDYNFASVLLTNLGSIKCNSIYHHLNEWGTNSIVGAIGTIHKEQVVNDKGKLEIRDIVDVGVTLDERIADGVYFAKSINLLKHILANPMILDNQIMDAIDYEIK
ncbi:MAG: 2-oxo acid dehydrogenase subunit E2 [Bacilli bacterium]|nr:2-oxo acid dehydrogenase subunit E2 [Bacilli bacterium]MDD4808852.1 2-oxo acid dehydrogenase subunit E2 [Bacilli bacterium]